MDAASAAIPAGASPAAGPPGSVPGVTDTTWLDATAQADLVRRGELAPAELVTAAIARIEAANPQLNAVLRTRFDRALREAASGPPDGPFRGVPILLKDLGCLVAGETTAFGLGPLRDLAWPVTSYLAGQFQAAGFVPLGRTTVPELGTAVTTEPRSFPPARNPWHPGHSAGGSSGGSAVAVASGMVPVAHASDGGGSDPHPGQCVRAGRPQADPRAGEPGPGGRGGLGGRRYRRRRDQDRPGRGRPARCDQRADAG